MKRLATVVAFASLGVGLIFGQAPGPQAPAASQGHDIAGHIRTMNEMMMHQLRQKDPDYEKRFTDMMIPHHEGAVLMAQNALQNANRPELQEMAKKRIEAQQKEIEQLKRWRQDVRIGTRTSNLALGKLRRLARPVCRSLDIVPSR
jgi:hypothetical protein